MGHSYTTTFILFYLDTQQSFMRGKYTVTEKSNKKVDIQSSSESSEIASEKGFTSTPWVPPHHAKNPVPKLCLLL